MFLKKGTSAIIDGPASLRIMSGEATILECPLRVRRSYLLRPWRRYPLYAETDVEYELTLGEGASHNVVEGSPIDQSWLEAAKKLCGDESVALIGGVDSGKTTLATLMSNVSVRESGRCVVVDLDPGQSYLSPPTTIGAAEITRPFHDLAQAEASYVTPIGSTSPTPVLDYQLRMSSELMKALRDAGLSHLIVDCDGWIEGEAAENYKARLLDIIQPSHVVFLEKAPETLLERVNEMGIAYTLLRSSERALRRSMDARKKLREMAYRRFLRNATLRTIPINWVELSTINSRALGDKQSPVEFFRRSVKQYVEANSQAELDVDKMGDFFLKGRIGLLTYLFDVNSKYAGIGLLAEIDLKRNVMRLFTPVTVQLKQVVLGNIFLNVFGDELFTVKSEALV